jgi:hypothetical protein
MASGEALSCGDGSLPWHHAYFSLRTGGPPRAWTRDHT